MSLQAHTVYHVQCDNPGCDKGTPDFETIHECKDHMEGEGWSGDTFVSYCPDCTSEGSREKMQANQDYGKLGKIELSPETEKAVDEAVETLKEDQARIDERQSKKKGGKRGTADKSATDGMESKG